MIVDRSKYNEIGMLNTNYKKQLHQLGLMGFFKVLQSVQSESGSRSYTILKVIDDAVLVHDDREIELVVLPGLVKTVSNGSSLILNWCVPGYIGFGEWPIELISGNPKTVLNGKIIGNIKRSTIYEQDVDNSDLRAYYIKQAPQEQPMDLKQEITDLKKEVEQLRALLADKPSQSKVEGASLRSIPTIPKQLIDYYMPSAHASTIRANPSNLAFIHKQVHAVCVQAVEANPSVLMYVHNQTPELCKIAVSNDPNALRFVEKQTDEICKLAIEKMPGVINLVRNPSVELIDYAFSMQSPKSYASIAASALALSGPAEINTYKAFKRYVELDHNFLAFVPEKYRTSELIICALAKNVGALSFLEDQTPYINDALILSYDAIKYVRKVTPDMYKTLLKAYVRPVSSQNTTGFDHLLYSFVASLDFTEIDDTYRSALEARLNIR